MRHITFCIFIVLLLTGFTVDAIAAADKKDDFLPGSTEFVSALDAIFAHARKGDQRSRHLIDLPVIRTLFGKENFEDAAERFRASAYLGYPPNKLPNLGQSAGEFNTPVPWETVVDLIRESADKGFAPAQNILARLHTFGWGVADDDTLMMKWHHAAAEQNYAPSQFDIGWQYLNSEGGPEDIVPSDKMKGAYILNLTTRSRAPIFLT